jgi:uncharacterized protein YidB (DUF937 family)
MDLFGKVMDMVMKKSQSGGANRGGTTNLDPGIFGNVVGGAMGKNNGMLSSMLRKMVASGLGKIVRSWVSRGPNHLITPDQVTQGLGQDQIASLAQQYGISPDQVSHILAEHLPDAVDQMTPDGELRDETGGIVDLTPKS